MNYARSYATTRRSRSVSRNSWRYPHKRRIEKLHFRSKNNYRKKTRSWRGLKTGIIRLGYFLSATTLVAGLSLLLTFGYHFLLTLPYFCLKGPEAIQITGQQRSQPELVLQQLQIKPGSSLLALQPLKVEAALLRQPWVAAVELHRQWPDRLSIRIKEHQAAAIVQLEELYLMSDRGRLFKVLEPQDPHDLPVITACGGSISSGRRDRCRRCWPRFSICWSSCGSNGTRSSIWQPSVKSMSIRKAVLPFTPRV